MKLALMTLAMIAAVSFSTQSAFANEYPRGGWDGNNVRVSVRQVKLLSQAKPTTANAHPGGGWDANNARTAVRHIKLLSSAKPPGGGWDLNDGHVSVRHIKLL